MFLAVSLAFDDWAISPAHYRRGLKWPRKQLGSSQTLSVRLKMKRLNKLLSWQAKSSKIINIKVLNIHTVKRGDLERKEKKRRNQVRDRHKRVWEEDMKGYSDRVDHSIYRAGWAEANWDKRRNETIQWKGIKMIHPLRCFRYSEMCVFSPVGYFLEFIL